MVNGNSNSSCSSSSNSKLVLADLCWPLVSWLFDCLNSPDSPLYRGHPQPLPAASQLVHHAVAPPHNYIHGPPAHQYHHKVGLARAQISDLIPLIITASSPGPPSPSPSTLPWRAKTLQVCLLCRRRLWRSCPQREGRKWRIRNPGIIWGKNIILIYWS